MTWFHIWTKDSSVVDGPMCVITSEPWSLYFVHCDELSRGGSFLKLFQLHGAVSVEISIFFTLARLFRNSVLVDILFRNTLIVPGTPNSLPVLSTMSILWFLPTELADYPTDHRAHRHTPHTTAFLYQNNKLLHLSFVKFPGLLKLSDEMDVELLLKCINQRNQRILQVN